MADMFTRKFHKRTDSVRVVHSETSVQTDDHVKGHMTIHSNYFSELVTTRPFLCVCVGGGL